MIKPALPITLENFQQVILEESKAKLVLVAFWAEQVPESVELKAKLEQATAAFSESLLMTEIDCQSQQQIAAQFGIQGLPTAVIIKDGQPIDGIAGPQTDQTIQAFLDKHLPKPQDGLLQQAQDALANQDANQAFTLAKQAYELDVDRADIKFVLIEACILIGKLDDAKALLETVKMVDQDATYQALVSKLELALEASDSPELKALEQALVQSPEDVELMHQLAAQYSQANRHEDALNLLFRRVQSVRDDAESKKKLLDVMNALPDGDPLTTKFRRKLYTLMY
ncbi:tetratricopeptide repeat protein [Thalassotalea sp. LPB0316]|uniref:tetratricopeptide repeat protein n=1 Tax=Thalassotalea sp. LPB0316 TaxID=2769490 RepID=UPI0018682DFD|nr:tetratricopeptide repeat protein [Thalassotalea sp. LPB0316]QOL25784.1 tetratricopeptide repeat protein [Thalassotalea sp. LPB0316]